MSRMQPRWTIQLELARANRAFQAWLTGQYGMLPLFDLFEPFQIHSGECVLKLELRADTMSYFNRWLAQVESRLRLLMDLLEKMPFVSHVRLDPKPTIVNLGGVGYSASFCSVGKETRGVVH